MAKPANRKPNSDSKGSFVTQAAILAAAGIIVRFIGFLYRIPLTRLIGDEGNDIYSSGYLLYTFFLILSSAGLPAAISKMISERVSRGELHNAEKIFKVSMAFSSAFGLVTAVFLAVFAQKFSEFVESPDSYLSVLVLSPTIFMVSVMSVFRGYFQGMRNTVPTAVSQIIEQVFNAVFSILLAYLLIKYGVKYSAAGGNAGTGIGALTGLITLTVVYFMYRPIINYRLRAAERGKGRYANANTKVQSNRVILKELVATALPIIIGTAIFSMTNLIDLKMVKSLLNASGFFTETEVSQMYGQLMGKYVLITTLPVALATAMATAIVPNIAASVVIGDKRQVNSKIKIALKITMIIAIPAAVGIGLLGDKILLMLFPNQPAGGILLKVGSISIVFLSLNQITTGILQGIGKVRIPAAAAAIGSIVKIPLNILLISNRHINIVGAVISTIICYLVASVIGLYVLIYVTKHRIDFIGLFFKPAIAAVVMGLGCYVSYYLIYMLVDSNTVACLFSIGSGVLTYLLVMLLVEGFTREDFDYLPMGARIAAKLYR